jgi:hypothetical protein
MKLLFPVTENLSKLKYSSLLLLLALRFRTSERSAKALVKTFVRINGFIIPPLCRFIN